MAIPDHIRQYIVKPFLAEVDAVNLGMSVPLHVAHRRVLLAEHVLADVAGDDMERLALRALADATTDLCWSPIDRETIERYLAARRGYLEVAQAEYDSR